MRNMMTADIGDAGSGGRPSNQGWPSQPSTLAPNATIGGLPEIGESGLVIRKIGEWPRIV